MTGINDLRAADLRSMAGAARRSYPETLTASTPRGLHSALLIAQAVGFEIAAALYGIASALEDLREDES